jgi:hypothetical protein
VFRPAARDSAELVVTNRMVRQVFGHPVAPCADDAVAQP